MEKLRALSNYLLESGLLAPDQLSSRAEHINLQMNWKPSSQGMCMGQLNYRAVLECYRTDIAPLRLMALVAAWLQRHDNDTELRKLDIPGCTVSPQVDQRHHLQLLLVFNEAVWLSEEPEGEFEAFGKRWGFVPYDLLTAEQAAVLDRGRSL